MRYHELTNETTAYGDILPIPTELIDTVVALTVEAFRGKGMPDEDVESLVREESDWSLSRMLSVDSKLAGFYLLRESSILDFADISIEDLSQYKNKRGVEGVALVVKPEFRNTGLGEKLKNLPATLGFDYVWGMQLKTLNNLQYWLKRRRLIADTGYCYVTLQDLR